MAAKDTVIKCDTSLTCCLDCHENQAEISFKAGMKEVVDTLGLHENELGFCEISNHVAYDQIEEWGIE